MDLPCSHFFNSLHRLSPFQGISSVLVSFTVAVTKHSDQKRKHSSEKGVVVTHRSRHSPSWWGGQDMRNMDRSVHSIPSEETDWDESMVLLNSLSPLHTVQGPHQGMSPTIAGWLFMYQLL